MVTTAMVVLSCVERAPVRAALTQRQAGLGARLFSVRRGRRVPVALTPARDPTRLCSGPRVDARGRSGPEDGRRRGLRACEVHSAEECCAQRSRRRAGAGQSRPATGRPAAVHSRSTGTRPRSSTARRRRGRSSPAARTLAPCASPPSPGARPAAVAAARARRPPAPSAGEARPGRRLAAAPEPDGRRAASTRPTRPYGAGHRGVDLLGRAGPAGARRAAGHGHASPAARRPRRRRGRPRRRPAPPTSRSPRPCRVGDAGRRRRGRSAPSSSPGSHCFPRACLHWGWIAGETYLDPLRLVGAGPVRLLPLWRDRARRRPPGAGPLHRCRRLAAAGRRSRPVAASGARVRLLVGPAQPVGGDVGVELGRRQRGVAEQLLHRAQVGAALEQVGGGGVPQPVRPEVGRARARRRSGGAPGCARRAGRSARRGRRGTAPAPDPSAEQRRPAAARARRRGARGRGPAERHGALLAALAEHPDHVAVAVDVVDVEAAPARRPGCRWRRAARASPRRAARPGCRRRRARSRRRSGRAPRRRAAPRAASGAALGEPRLAPASVGARPVRASHAGEHPGRGRPPGQRGPRPAQRLLLGQPAAQRAQVERRRRRRARAGAACSSSAGDVAEVGADRVRREVALGRPGAARSRPAPAPIASGSAVPDVSARRVTCRA